MLSLGLSLLVFLFWTAVGRAVLVACRLRLGWLRSCLLAPGLGLSVLTVGLMLGNQGGWPIRAFAWPLTLVLTAGAAALLIRRRLWPWRTLMPYGLVALGFLFWASWPALWVGFDWISYVNEDFTNYCLAADRVRDFGFYRTPTLAELGGRDYSQFFWFMHVSSLMRFGAEQTVAWLSVLSGRDTVRIFMPLMGALGLMQIAAAAGLVLHAGRWRRLALATAVLLAASPLFILGHLYQLIAQSGGVGLMLAVVAFLTARLAGRRRRAVLAHAVPTALVGAALGVFYPEVTPFALMTLAAVFAVEVARTRRLPGARIVLVEYAIVGVALLLRHNFITCIYTLGQQLVTGTQHVDQAAAIFPFFLIPSGLAGLFGLQALNTDLPEPRGSILVIIGFLLLVAAFWGAGRAVRRGAPVGCLFLVQGAVAFKLFAAGSDFGLFKLAMIIQPALVASLAWSLWRLPWRRLTVPLALAALMLAARPVALRYTRASSGREAGSFTELRGASARLSRVPPPPAPGAHWVSSIDNIVAVEIAAHDYRGSDLTFLSRDFFTTRGYYDTSWPYVSWYPHAELFAEARTLLRQRADAYLAERELFDSHFTIMRQPASTAAYLELPSDLSLFNKAHVRPSSSGALYEILPAAAAQNLLVFMHSTRGHHYYSYHYSIEELRTISFFQQEPDYFNPGGAFNGLGRFILMRVERPTAPLYLDLAITKSVMGGGRTALPAQARILGAAEVPCGFVGGGAAHRIIGPITPVWLDGSAFIAIDFGEKPEPFAFHRTGLKALYGTRVPLDFRWLVAEGRDISALSSAERDALTAPRRVAAFPGDLLREAGLEYSGIYEDGWLSAAVDFTLGPSRAGEGVRLRGFVPELPGARLGGALVVTINGQAAAAVSAPPAGAFDWRFPVARPGRATKISLRFAFSGKLPSGDDRPVSAKLDSLEIVPASAP